MPLLDDGKEWDLFHGDCIPHLLRDMPEECVDFSIYSPPFPSVFSYTDSNADVGNVDAMDGEASVHLSFMFNGLYRVLKPGRAAIVHVAQIPRMKRSGGVGLCDFRGITLRLAERAGFIYEYDWSVRKNPQALRNGTNVLTPDGWVEINNLSIGDEVIGSSGRSTVVTGVFPHDPRQMYRVRFSDGTSVECDDNHLWQVRTIRGRSRTMTTKEIREFGVTSESGDRRFKIPMIEGAVQFNRSETLPIDPYTLGAIIGDGCTVSRGCVFLTTESEIVDNCTVPDGYEWKRTKHGKRAGTVATFNVVSDEWHNNEIVSGIRDLGLFGKRSWEKFIPNKYLFADAYSRLEILRGIMDTDGTIKTNSGIVCKLCTTSKEIAEGVQFIAESLGGVARIDTEDNSRYEYKGEIRFGRRKYLVSLRMPDGCNPFKMERKASRWVPTKKEICRWIVSIEPTDIAPCTCIQVDAADSLYVTEHCIVTHNSQAIRTRSRELQFAGLESDRAAQRGTLQDYLIKIRKPGSNAVPIRDWDTDMNEDGDEVEVDKYSTQVSRNDWIKWAEGCWDDIQETDTLNTAAAKSDDDTRHICPLQIEVIRRCILLFSNPGEIVFSPFAGIGSEGYVALGGKSPKTGKYLHDPRRFYGCELKDEYYDQAKKNLAAACANRASAKAMSLFDEDEGL